MVGPNGSAGPGPFPIGDASSLEVQLVKNPGSGDQCRSASFPALAKTLDLSKLKFVDKVP